MLIDNLRLCNFDRAKGFSPADRHQSDWNARVVAPARASASNSFQALKSNSTCIPVIGVHTAELWNQLGRR